MPYPNFEGKHGGRPVMTPEALLAWRRRSGHLPDDVPAPQAAILTYQVPLYRHILETEQTTHYHVRGSVGRIDLLQRTSDKVAVAGEFGFGAPVSTIVLENLVALGVRRFISMGTAGGLQPGQAFGDIVVCTAALRDEGVSHHYEPPERWAHPSPGLTRRLGAALSARDVAHVPGTAWTIDTPFMETDAEVRHYRDEGIACVDMEAAALFCVAQRRGVSLAAAFALSDEVGPEGWKGGFHAPEVATSLWSIYEAAVDCLLEDAAADEPA